MTSTDTKLTNPNLWNQFQTLWFKLLHSKHRLKIIAGIGITLVVLIGLGSVLFLGQQTQENRSAASGAGTPPKVRMYLSDVSSQSGDRDPSKPGLQLAPGEDGVINLDISAGSLPVVAAEVFVYYNSSELEVIPDINQNQRNEFEQIARFTQQPGKDNGQLIRFLLARSPEQKALAAGQRVNFASLRVKMKKTDGSIVFTDLTVTTDKVKDPLIVIGGLANSDSLANGLALHVSEYSPSTAPPQPSVIPSPVTTIAPQPSIVVGKPKPPIIYNVKTDGCYRSNSAWLDTFLIGLDEAETQPFTSYDVWARVLSGNPASGAATDVDKQFTADWTCNRSVWDISGITDDIAKISVFRNHPPLGSLTWQRGSGGSDCSGVEPSLSTGDYTLRTLVAGWKDGQYYQSDPASAHFSVDKSGPMFADSQIQITGQYCADDGTLYSSFMAWNPAQDVGCAGGEVKYQAEVATDAGFSNIIRQQTTSKPEYLFYAQEGEANAKLFVRVFAIDRFENKSEPITIDLGCIGGVRIEPTPQ